MLDPNPNRAMLDPTLALICTTGLGRRHPNKLAGCLSLTLAQSFAALNLAGLLSLTLTLITMDPAAVVQDVLGPDINLYLNRT